MMLRAGLTKLQRLEEEFVKQDEKKNPKMLIVCQDTTVSPFVEEFLKSEGLGNEDIVTIDSNKQGEVKDEEWQEIKKKLFDIDRYKSPKVVVSVLMLREGFDVNNICVLVPLRSSQAPILLEQLVGRGLRLMWREPDYQEVKREDRLRRMEAAREQQRKFAAEEAEKKTLKEKRAEKQAAKATKKKNSTNESGRIGDRPYARGRSYDPEHYGE